MLHIQVGEDASLSQPAGVDLSRLFASMDVAAVRELSLTGNQYRDEMGKRFQWSVSGPINASSNGTAAAEASVPVLGAENAVDGKEASGGGAGRLPRAEPSADQYDVWNHDGDKLPRITLYPMEIRTFEVSFWTQQPPHS